jgi:hypothetical protein
VDNTSDEHLLEAYMGGLKEDIKHEIFLKHLENIMEAMQFAHHIQARNKTTHKSTIGAYAGSRDHFGVHKTTLTQPNRMSHKEMEEIRAKRLCFGCSNKWLKGHKCQETKLFTLENSDEEEVDASTQRNEEELVNLKEKEIKAQIVNNIESYRCEIYVHALAGLSTP